MEYTHLAKQVVEQAKVFARQQGCREVNSLHLLAAFVPGSERAGVVADILRRQGMVGPNRVLAAVTTHHFALGAPVAASVDLPWSGFATDVTRRASSAAEKFGHPDITAEALLLSFCWAVEDAPLCPEKQLVGQFFFPESVEAELRKIYSISAGAA